MLESNSFCYTVPCPCVGLHEEALIWMNYIKSCGRLLLIVQSVECQSSRGLKA